MATAVHGRKLGPRALRTRRRLLDATAELLRERGLRGASVAEIARRAGTSPASFYQYFTGVEAATLELAGEAAQGVPALESLLDGPLEGEAGLRSARALAAAFFDLWDAHHAVLRVRNHAAEEGARRFRKKWREALRPLLDALARRLGGDAGAAERAGGFHPYAAAAAMATILESAGAYHRELAYFGIDREALIETSARLLVETASLAAETSRAGADPQHPERRDRTSS